MDKVKLIVQLSKFFIGQYRKTFVVAIVAGLASAYAAKELYQKKEAKRSSEDETLVATGKL